MLDSRFQVLINVTNDLLGSSGDKGRPVLSVGMAGEYSYSGRVLRDGAVSRRSKGRDSLSRGRLAHCKRR